MEEQVQSVTPEKKSHKKSIIIVLSVIILIILISVVGFILINNLRDDTPTADKKTSEESVVEQTGEPTPIPSFEIKYTCSDNKSIDVAIYNQGASPSAKLLLSDGTSVMLYPTVSASGAKYTNSDESMVFWTKGDEAYIEENGKQTYSDCVESS